MVCGCVCCAGVVERLDFQCFVCCEFLMEMKVGVTVSLLS